MKTEITMAACAALALLACSPEPVTSVVLTPTTPELAEVLRLADERWEAAGVSRDRIIIGESGAPVRFVPERAPISETRTTYRASDFMGVRWMELSSLDVDNATHELGHALGIGGFISHPFDEADCEGSDRPLMCRIGGSHISEPDLEVACSVGDCAHFDPEI
jgi:hypothetical protein